MAAIIGGFIVGGIAIVGTIIGGVKDYRDRKKKEKEDREREIRENRERQEAINEQRRKQAAELIQARADAKRKEEERREREEEFKKEQEEARKKQKNNERRLQEQQRQMDRWKHEIQQAKRAMEEKQLKFEQQELQRQKEEVKRKIEEQRLKEEARVAQLKKEKVEKILKSTFRRYRRNQTQYKIAQVLDLGTCTSGVASCTITNSTPYVHTWENGATKTNTAILFDAQGHVEAFGTAAEDKYATLRPEQRANFKLFSCFKMGLYNNGKEIDLDVEVEAVDGRSLPAVQVLASSLAQLSKRAMVDLRKQGVALENDNVLTIITFPSLWGTSARRLIKEASLKAGLCTEDSKEEQVRLLYECAAAAEFCSDLNIVDMVSENYKEKDIRPSEAGDRILVIDAGGGTVDISLQKKTDIHDYELLCPPISCPSGGERVNKKMISLIRKLFGDDVFESWSRTHQRELLRLLAEVEERKCKWNGERGTDIVLCIPSKLSKMKDEEDIEMEAMLLSEDLPGAIFSDGCEITFTGELIESFFEQLVKEIYHKVRQLPQLQLVNAVCFVGGFSQSPYLIKALPQMLKQVIPNIEPRIPREAVNAVMKGGLLLKWKQQTEESNLSSWQAQKTICVLPIIPTSESEDVDVQHVIDKKRAQQFFRRFPDYHIYSIHGELVPILLAGEVIRLEGFKSAEFGYTRKQLQIKKVIFVIYSSTQSKVEHLRDFHYEGVVALELPECSREPLTECSVAVVFEGVELRVFCVDHVTGEYSSTKIEFLHRDINSPT